MEGGLGRKGRSEWRCSGKRRTSLRIGANTVGNKVLQISVRQASIMITNGSRAQTFEPTSYRHRLLSSPSHPSTDDMSNAAPPSVSDASDPTPAGHPEPSASTSTERPVLELLPPSPTRLSFSGSSTSSNAEGSDADAPRPSAISEIVRICAGGGAVERAESVRSAREEVEAGDGAIIRRGFLAPFGSGIGGGLSKAAPGRLMRLALPWRRKDVTEPIRVSASPTPSAREGTFARGVVIKGWQIVGGKGFDEAKGKVGAYVGGSFWMARKRTDALSVRY